MSIMHQGMRARNEFPVFEVVQKQLNFEIIFGIMDHMNSQSSFKIITNISVLLTDKIFSIAMQCHQSHLEKSTVRLLWRSR